MAVKQINLYQAEFRPVRVVLPARTLFLGALGLAACLLALYAWESWQLGQFREQVAAVTAQADKLAARVGTGNTPPRAADPQILAEAARLEARLATLDRAQAAVAAGSLGSATGYAAQFQALARATSPGAWLTRVDVTDQGREVNLKGRALTGEDTARLVASLRGQPVFAGLNYALLDVAPPAGGNPSGTPSEQAAAAPPRFLEFTLAGPHAAPAFPALPGGKP